MKRVLIFSVAYYPFVGGAEVAVKEITDRISPQDIEFHMVTVNLSGRELSYEKIGNVHVHRVGKYIPGAFLRKYSFPLIGMWKGAVLHRVAPFDAIWSIMASAAGGAALFFKMKYPRVRFILTLQEGDPIAHIRRRVWFIYPLFLQIFRRANVIQAISHYLVDMARSMGATAPIHMIPNGVDTARFTHTYPQHDLTALSHKLGKKEGDVFLITTSRLVYKNGIDTVIDALALLPSNYHFLVIGEGVLEMSLKKQAQRNKVSDRVHFLGFISHDDIPKYLKISDIFVRPSRSEGMGNSFIEAMAAGVPVIATPVGGIPDFLEDGKTGLMCKVGDPASVALAVEKLVGDSTFRGEIVSHASTCAGSSYDWNTIVTSMKKEVFG